MAGRTSSRWRNISNEALPEPMMTAARISVTCTGPAARIRPDFVTAGQMTRQLLGVVLAESAEVDDPRYVGALGCSPGVLRADSIRRARSRRSGPSRAPGSTRRRCRAARRRASTRRARRRSPPRRRRATGPRRGVPVAGRGSGRRVPRRATRGRAGLRRSRWRRSRRPSRRHHRRRGLRGPGHKR